MFAVFAVFAESSFEVRALNGRGETPQLAWEDMLTEYEIDESEIDMDSVEFYRTVEVFHETRVSWTVCDSDD